MFRQEFISEGLKIFNYVKQKLPSNKLQLYELSIYRLTDYSLLSLIFNGKIHDKTNLSFEDAMK